MINKNPLINENTTTTLLQIRSVITLLQEFYCLNDIPGKQPPEGVAPELYTGIYFVLDIVDGALAFEIEKMESAKA